MKPVRREYVVQTLKQFATEKQASLLAELHSHSKNQKVGDIQSLWIANVVMCSATSDVIESLAKRNDIREIDHDEIRQIISADQTKNMIPNQNTTRDDREITWNVTLVNSDDVWNMGFTGSGVLVSVIDTGVNYDHQDLTTHMWNGGLSYPHHGYDFHDNDNDPLDDHGHGTHCAGTVAGDGSAGSQTGVAPDATIMACKTLDSEGSGFESSTWEAIEFSVEHGADIISMSLGWMHAWSPNRSVWRSTMDNALSAGTIASVAAANSGDNQWTYPIPDNVATPGDCPPPWLHPDQTLTGGLSAVVCVGATNSNDGIADFSSRGPVTWENINNYNDYAYNPEMGLIRPDVSAPGVDIKSLAHYSNTGYESGWMGTSMATPCVAGVMALMLSYQPLLTPEQISQYLEETAVHLGSSGKNNDYGSGRVDAYEAVNAIFINPVAPNPAHTPNPIDTGDFVNIETNLTWSNGGGAASYQIFFGTDNPPTNMINGENVSTSSFNSLPTLEYSTDYFWKVIAVNEYGTTEGSTWSFTTSPSADEDFETGDFSAHPWSFAGNANWTIVSSNPLSGNYCAKSGNISSDQTSSLLLTVDASVASDIRFWKRVSCEEDQNDNWDYLAFFIDGVEQGRWDGEVSWSAEVFSVSQGQHILEWKYLKDGAVDSGADAAWIDFIFLPTQLVEVSTNQIMNWNIVGLPTNVSDPQVTSVYPSSIVNTCYAYGPQGYYMSTDLDAGLGYWLRFPENGNTSVFGIPISEMTLSLTEGWNLISGISVETNLNIISDPGNILVPNTIYGYSTTGYYNSPTMTPGNGYWIRTTSDGEITISSRQGHQGRTLMENRDEHTFNQLTINGSKLYFGKDLTEEELLSYSLPPKPPVGAFDVRFRGEMKYSEGNGIIEIMNPTDGIRIDYHILQGESWKLTGDIGEEIIISDEGTLDYVGAISEIHLEKKSLIPTEFALHQNYPNPFNPKTTISFSLPITGSELQDVTLKVYDIRGCLVRTLLSGSLNAGYHEVEWNGRDGNGHSVASGMYLYQLNSAGTVHTKKLLLLK